MKIFFNTTTSLLVIIATTVLLLLSSHCVSIHAKQLLDISESPRDKQLFNEYASELLLLNGGVMPEVEEFSHTCIHDTLIGAETTTRANIEMAVTSTVSSSSSSAIPDVTGSNGDTSNKLPTATPPPPTSHPIRIIVNTTFLMSSLEPQTCFHIGQKVNISGPYGGVATQDCATIKSTPCVWTCTASDLVTTSYANAISSIVIDKVVNMYQSTLNISGTAKTNYVRAGLNTYPCSEQFIKLDPNWQTQGFDGDLILYVTSHPIPGSTLAYASACAQDQATGRPTVAFINMNPNRFTQFATPANRVGIDWEMYYRVLIHEVTHGLGFSRNLYNSFLDPTTGSKYTTSPTTTTTYQGVTPLGETYSRERYYLTTPTVTKFVREHFNCSSLIGAELENYGGSGTVMSHWKGTFFGEEMMLGSAQVKAPLTKLTLALLYDSGWYVLDDEVLNTKSEPLIWGKSLGCPFTETCTPESWAFPGYFPNASTVSNTRGCSATRSGKGYLIYGVDGSGGDLAPYQQHFKDKRTGGAFFFKDKCPYTDVYSTSYQQNTAYCFDTAATPNKNVYEVFGSDSLCFEYVPTGSSTIQNACWPQRCNPDNDTMEIGYNNQWFACNSGNQLISTGDGNTIVCPPNFNICGVVSSTLENHHDNNNNPSTLRRIIRAPLTDKQNELIEKYAAELRKLNNGEMPMDHAPLKHNCVHDHLTKDSPPQPSPIPSGPDAEVGQEQEQEPSAKFGGILQRPFRILLNTDYMNPQNEPQTCSYVNQKVTIGGPGSGTAQVACDSTGRTPCIWTCKAADVASQSYQNAIISIVGEKVVSFFEELLTVPTTYNQINKVSSSGTYACQRQGQYLKLDPTWSTTGFNADMVLFLSSHPVPGSTIAYAATCISDNVSGRPLVSFTNLNPSYFSPFVNATLRQGPDWELYFRVMVHEVTHSLGFSSSAMPGWINPNTGLKYPGGPLLIRTDMFETPSGQSYSRERYFLTTPFATQFVRDHFNCSDLIGPEMENVGGPGTNISHWKGTPFGEEDMIGYGQVIAPYTNLTLALLKDTGWYSINESAQAEPLIWGKGMGCAFPEGCSQKSWNYPGYWDFPAEGTNGGVKGCSATRSGKGYLLLAKYQQTLQPPFQHFEDPAVGGGYSFKDLCPYTDVYKSSQAENNVYCLDTSVTPDNSVYETFGANSYCYEYTKGGDDKINLACWVTRCSANNTLQVLYNQDWLTCDVGGKTISLPSNVTFHCPNDFYLCGVVPQVPSSLPYKYAISVATHTSAIVSFGSIIFLVSLLISIF
ncbi:hypothetical protein DFA_01547 [Cavenderia fasciculata]|uniref:Peptidase M8 n=1 Tax=Cavenderia fasciculata TaxID=261658 RepID=F4PTD9_CACFS|nr:uncharacterized protein DFA_01547 [Cavenderia fasciculata]EGG21661.1 hypothetical protein DFA_01547 [Cavenderia fasciculata]|eukprot:XP_004359511.1 hypothetical protein DFA_01547 [Cavenderia fasciculata]